MVAILRRGVVALAVMASSQITAPSFAGTVVPFMAVYLPESRLRWQWPDWD